MATSRILQGSTESKHQHVTTRDWVTYPILRFKDAPEVTPIVIDRTDQLSKRAGEIPLSSTASAIRERVLPTQPRPPPRSPDDARARPRRPESGRRGLSDSRYRTSDRARQRALSLSNAYSANNDEHRQLIVMLRLERSTTRGLPSSLASRRGLRTRIFLQILVGRIRVISLRGEDVGRVSGPFARWPKHVSKTPATYPSGEQCR